MSDAEFLALIQPGPRSASSANATPAILGEDRRHPAPGNFARLPRHNKRARADWLGLAHETSRLGVPGHQRWGQTDEPADRSLGGVPIASRGFSCLVRRPGSKPRRHRRTSLHSPRGQVVGPAAEFERLHPGSLRLFAPP